MTVGKVEIIGMLAATELYRPPITVSGYGEHQQTGPDLVPPCASLGLMVVRSISQAKAELSALIEQVQQGHEVILAKAGKPVAKIVPYHGPAQPRTAGSMVGKIWISPDFDTLPDDIAEAFGHKDPEP